jgi:putative transposase
MEAFNSRFRQQCLNEYWFLSVTDAQERAEVWRRHYREERPHRSLGNLTPEAHVNQAGPVLPRTGPEPREELGVLA